MENKDSILDKSEEPEECKINDSNKDLDGDLYLFLPKNVVDEISEKKSENVPKKPHKNSDKKKKPENNLNINNQIIYNNNPQKLNFITNIQNINTINNINNSINSYNNIGNVNNINNIITNRLNINDLKEEIKFMQDLY